MINAAMPLEERPSLKGGIWFSIVAHIVLLSILIWTAAPVASSRLGDPTVEMVFPDYKLAKGEPGPKAVEHHHVPTPVKTAPPPPPKTTQTPARDNAQNALTSPNSESDPIAQKPDKIKAKPQPKPKPKPQPDDLDKMMKDMAKEQPKKKPVEKPKADDKSLLDALDKLKKENKASSKTKTSAKNSSAKTGAGGSDDTTMLSAGQQTAIGDEVRRCYEQDTQSHDYASFTAHLLVTIDGSGTARRVDFAPETRAKMEASAPYRALAERARMAVLSSACAKLPMPSSMLGRTRTLRFVFRP